MSSLLGVLEEYSEKKKMVRNLLVGELPVTGLQDHSSKWLV